jgi:hypothetical protein
MGHDAGHIRAPVAEMALQDFDLALQACSSV